MEISAHYALITFNEKGIPYLYVVYSPSNQVKRASMALDLVKDGSMESRSPSSLIRLYLDSPITIEAGLTQAVKKHLSEHPRGIITLINVTDIKSFEQALKARLADNVAYSLRREQELTLTPQMRADRKESNKRIDDFMNSNPNFLDDALRRKWLKKLTGLLLIEGEQKLINSEMVPQWAKSFISGINVLPLTIVEDERLIYNMV